MKDSGREQKNTYCVYVFRSVGQGVKSGNKLLFVREKSCLTHIFEATIFGDFQYIYYEQNSLQDDR